MIKDSKYLFAYVVPLLTASSIYSTGILCYTTLIFVFILIPILEPIFPLSTYNLNAQEQTSYKKNTFFDWMLYMNVPIIYLLLGLYIFELSTHTHSLFEQIGMMLSVGTMMGAGINVAHELGHKNQWYKQFLAKLILLPCQYMHFIIEHNLGHHKYVATDQDPASAKKNEMVYFFWLRSMTLSYFSAWKLEKSRLNRLGLSPWSTKNQMIHFLFTQLLFTFLIFWFFGLTITLLYMGSALVSVLLLETINYIEHYALRRERKANGKYERVKPIHSWNSEHQLGRILLYELTRHSDHHYLAHKKYQLLDHHREAKQLPFGYPTSMLLSLCPPLWFKVMNSRI